MSERPWSTMPITGAQHEAWMAERERIAANFCQPSNSPFPHPRCSENCRYSAYWDARRAEAMR